VGLREQKQQWDCDWCRKIEECWSGPPKQWQWCVLHGTEDAIKLEGQDDGKTNRHHHLLCDRCVRVYHEGLKDLAHFSSDFWWQRVRFIAQGEPPRSVDLPWTKRDAETTIRSLSG
jgi:hypothetical protein